MEEKHAGDLHAKVDMNTVSVAPPRMLQRHFSARIHWEISELDPEECQ